MKLRVREGIQRGTNRLKFKEQFAPP